MYALLPVDIDDAVGVYEIYKVAGDRAPAIPRGLMIKLTGLNHFTKEVAL